VRRGRRLRWRRATSAPYLSGDALRSLADVALEAGRPDLERQFQSGYRTARAIFVKTDRLPDFLDRYAPHAGACRVLLTGNSDLDIDRVPAGLPPSLHIWFAQNAVQPGGPLRVLPIGLENQALGVNGVPSYFRACTQGEIAAKRLRVLAAFHPGTPERRRLFDLVAGTACVDRADRRLTPRAFQARLRTYRFVLAPRGNGLDTHRFWEALYADAIPIVRRSAWSAALHDEGVPLVEVGDWDELRDWSPAELARLSSALPDQPSTTPFLWLPFWRERVTAGGTPHRP
jgi:hypothetical protein